MTDEDEATCKRFFREVDHIRLQPENDALAPILLDNVTILGKVGLYRNHINKRKSPVERLLFAC